MPLSNVNKVAHSGFETQRKHHQKSKTGVSVAPEKGLMSSKKLFKKCSHNIATDSSIVYFMVFLQWLNVPLERIAYWPVVDCVPIPIDIPLMVMESSWSIYQFYYDP